MKNILNKISSEMEFFLEQWAHYMSIAGYLEHTTAKREDCIMSLNGIVEPLKKHLEKHGTAEFTSILKDHRNLAEFLIGSASKHKARGINVEMFIGCFKTFIHAIEDIIKNADIPQDEKLEGIVDLRRAIDAIETIVMQDWFKHDSNDAITILSKTNRELTLNKNKYENIFEATSDLVIVTNESGDILEMNAASRGYFENVQLNSRAWAVLGVESDSMQNFLNRYPIDKVHELKMPDGITTVSLRLVPLKRVSLASAGYVLILSDITCMVDHRAKLEKTVQERTAALATSEKLFKSLFHSAGVGILLTDTNMNIVESNQKADDIFGMTKIGLKDVNCRKVFHPNSIDVLETAKLRANKETWNGELEGVTASGDSFPASITVNNIEIDEEYFFHIIVRDITRQKALEEFLRQEKQQAEEMNVTLRNVLKTIDTEKDEFERSISQRITTQVIPSLNKLAAEGSGDIREMYLEITKNQLLALTKSGGRSNQEAMMKLSKSEIQICQLIQSGYSSKDVADTMNISFETVQTHRKNIRKKLGLSGKDVNLYSYLTNS